MPFGVDYIARQAIDDGNYTIILDRISSDVDDNQWLGVGFGDSMNSTDMLICKVAGGDASCEDYWSSGTTMPTKDTKQSWHLVSNEFGSPRMKFQVTRKMDSNDTQDLVF